ncbi:sensor histidine kinase, partial [Hymenobacter saemangeumensis]|uniref:sensor histidine kinase n=1 Tax=Hymenobacter saemangeumensis TaxID=1084522 RepID=UPI0031F15A10
PDGRLKVQLEVVGLDQGGRLEPTVENVLFRVIQELVQNIIKHAQATQVTLQIIRSERELTVMVEDNGVGFDPKALGEEAGIGLRNIESRMAYLGGQADFDAAPGRGTTVVLEVPLTAVSQA